MKRKLRIQPMTGIQKYVQACKMKEKMEEMEEAMMEANAIKMALMSQPKKRK